jgi:hypothetical protein
MRTEQMQIVSVEQIMPETHNYRKRKELLKFTSIVRTAKATDSDLGANGFGRERLVLCLLLQFMEDTSDPPTLPSGRRGVHPMVILRDNMQEKTRDLDRWLSKLRAPYEGTFSKQNKRVRYRGVVKNQGAKFLYAVAYNFRRLLAISAA